MINTPAPSPAIPPPILNPAAPVFGSVPSTPAPVATPTHHPFLRKLSPNPHRLRRQHRRAGAGRKTSVNVYDLAVPCAPSNSRPKCQNCSLQTKGVNRRFNWPQCPEDQPNFFPVSPRPPLGLWSRRSTTNLNPRTYAGECARSSDNVPHVNEPTSSGTPITYQ